MTKQLDQKFRKVQIKTLIFIEGISNEGIISGNGKYFKEINKKNKVIGVKPANSLVINKGKVINSKEISILLNILSKVMINV